MRKSAHASHLVRFSMLRGRPTAVDLAPDAAARKAIAAELGIRAVRKLRLTGTLAPLNREDWQLDAMLGATVVQDCVVTLEPVTSRIDEPVMRTYLAAPPELPDAEEIEMPEDDTVEPLPETLDLGAVMIEALALALPAYPHVEGVSPLEASFTEPGKTAMTDEEAKPFAGLAGIRDRMGKKDG